MRGQGRGNPPTVDFAVESVSSNRSTTNPGSAELIQYPGEGEYKKMTRSDRSLKVSTVARAVAAALCLAAGSAAAQTDAAGMEELRRLIKQEATRLLDLERSINDQERMLEANRAVLEEQRKRINALLEQLSGRGIGVSPMMGEIAQAQTQTPTPVPTPAQAPQQAPVPVQAPQQAPAGQQRPVGEAPPTPERPAAPAQLFDEPTALTPRGKFVVEPSFQFVHSSDNRVALVGFAVVPALTIGLIDVRQVTRDIYQLALTGRWGVTNRFELELKVPYVWADSSTLTRPLATPSFTDQFFDANGSGIGDVEFAGRYQFNQFRGDNAVYIGSLRYKAPTGKGIFEVPFITATDEETGTTYNTGLQKELPTGSGFHALQVGGTVIYPSDPAIFFGGLAYTYSFPRTFENYGRVAPGSAVDANLGLGLAMNERASFSIGFQYSVIGKTSQDDALPAFGLATGTTLQLGTMRFGLSYRLTSKLNMNLSLGAGITEQTPDFEATLRLPYTF